MIRLFNVCVLVGVVLTIAGCGTCCRRQTPVPAPLVVAPPVPSRVVPAGGATFGAPTPFPTVPPAGANFGAPTPFPTSPPNVPAPGLAPPNVTPSITPLPSKSPEPSRSSPEPSRTESKWLPGADREAPPRIQLYAPEPIEKEKAPLDRKPQIRSTFPVIAQFAEAKANVYAGLRPGIDGFDWLQTNKVGTIVQVRLFGEDDSADKKAAEDRGMRYIAFEVSPVTLTKEKADEFIKLIREGSERGIFVYDQDGSLAGSMWYLYLRFGETLNDETAQLRARGLGLQNTRDGQFRDMWLAVQKVLSEQ